MEAADVALYKVGLSPDWPATHRPTFWTRLSGLYGTDASGPSALEWTIFGTGALLAALLCGFLLDLILAQAGFGLIINGLLAVGGAMVGFAIRYLLFADEEWEAYEPALSAAPVVIMMLVTLGGAILAKWRIVR